MATAYLLASVLTLLVVLVRGQEAIHEQENLVVVAEDSFEDELNSFTDLILPGSTNTRAECILKKKCKNKGGTCQNKGNTCPGKFVKGCSKGCSCCLPEEISCKPSKRCKRANGACIARGECNGKIISTGCKKPKSCKKTHVCCVQDETVTELPTCRGVSSCPVSGECPNEAFKKNYVCDKCKKDKNVLDFMNKLVPQPQAGKPYPVFYNKDYNGEVISYVTSEYDPLCIIENPVKAWICQRPESSWECKYEGFCIGKSLSSDGVYVEDSIKRKCPNEKFLKDYVCDGCKKDLNVVKKFVKEKGQGNIHPVFAKKGYGGERFSFITSEDNRLCTIRNPVKTWICQRPTLEGEWECTFKGFSNSKSDLSNGAYTKDSIEIICPNGKFYEEHVCEDCPTSMNIRVFVNNLKFETDPGVIDSYRVFSNKDNEDNYINFISKSIKEDRFCLIKNPVKTWICTRKEVEGEWKWTCNLKGFCTGESNFKTGDYREDSETCVCPNGKFYENNVCEKCTNTENAEEFVTKVKHNQIEISSYPVFGSKDYDGNMIKFIESDTNTCLIKKTVETWICSNTNVDKKWTCDLKGFCNGESNFVPGNYIADSEKCKCPNGNFIKEHVCKGCDSRGKVVEFLKKVQPKPKPSYTVFGDKDYSGNMITFKTSADKKSCIIENPVQIWICEPNMNGEWDPEKCKLQGYCTAESDFITGAYTDGNIKCNCPSPIFEEKHVCSDCKTGFDALEYTKKRQKGDGPNTILDGHLGINYDDDVFDNQKTCKIIHPVSVKAWDVMRNTKKEWYLWQDLGQCINLQSALNNGHLFFEIKKCYKQTSNIWGDDQCDTVGEVFISKDYEKCMVECESRPGCTAINYEVDKECTMKNCRVPVPTPNKDTTGFVGYYLNTGYKQTSNIWGDDQCDTVGAVLESTNYEKCMVECKSRPGCTAINYEVGKECTMKNCRVPVPTPNKDTTGFVGYYLFDIGPSTEI